MVEVGIRELRQSLSVYLRRVAEGERFVVTDRNRPVAVLGPLPENDDPFERLIAEGRLSRPKGDLLDIEPIVLDGPPSLSEILEEMRNE